MEDFKSVSQLNFWVQKVLPLVYDDSLSYYELLNKVVKKLNDLIANNEKLPQYIAQLIQEYISSGAIGEVVRNILTDFMLNVKNPPKGLIPAAGDGTAEDTDAIQGCINYARDNGGKAVYFPSGVYLTKPLVLYDNVTLFGFDSNTTRVVLHGGSTKAMITGECNGVTIKGLSFDGNMDIQVNNLDLIVLKGKDYLFTDLRLTDGYDLLNLDINGNCIVNTVIFDKAVRNGFVSKGAGNLLVDNIIFNHLSTLNGNRCIITSVDNSVFENVYSVANVSTAIEINANNVSIRAKLNNAVNAYINNGSVNNIHIIGKEELEYLSGKKEINAKDIVLDSVNPITYKEPKVLNNHFNYVNFRFNGLDYKVLVQGATDIDTTIQGIRESISTAIIDLTELIQNTKDELEQKINAKAILYLQENEPTVINNQTLWLSVNSTLNLSGDGVAIGNAETSNNEPSNVPYWFDHIESEE